LTRPEDVDVPGSADASPRSRRRPRLYGWTHPAILSAAGVSVAAGFAQFGAIAALGDVAAAFGETGVGDSVAAQAGLSGTTLGIGLAVIRLASLGALPLAGLGDRFGRRRVLLTCCGLGLAMTAAAALSPSYWWFVAIFALGRPMLSATNAVAGVIAAEETRSVDRAKALALIAAAYGLGAGMTALLRGGLGEMLTFRGLFALALVPLLLLPLLGRVLEEPDRYTVVRASADARKRLGHVAADLRPRLALLAGLMFAVALMTGPANSLLFVFAENVVGMDRGATGAIVFAAGPVGLTGLLIGRWCADRIGRRVTAGTAMGCIGLVGILTYSGTSGGVAAGYLLGVVAQSSFGPAAGALAAELFPTSVRSTVAGWLTAAGVLGAVTGLLGFGMLADALGGFTAAAAIIAIPVVAASMLFLRLPETMGMELEDSAPET
jgi:MFS family permease